MANQLDDFLNANTKERKPFSMTDYEAIPLENRQEYVKTTSIPAKNQRSEQIDIDGQIKAKAPLDPSKAEAIKQIFRPQPAAPRGVLQEEQVPPQAPVQEAAPYPQIPSDDIDMGKIREQAASMQAPTSWEDWLPALAPLITEALMGGNGKSAGESLGVSGKYLTDTVADKTKRQQSLEDKLLERDKARYLASLKAQSGGKLGKRYQRAPRYDEITGKVYDDVFDTYTGNRVPTDTRTGLAVVNEEFKDRTKFKSGIKRSDADYLGANTKVNPQTGELEVIRQGKSTPIETSQEPRQFNKKQEADVESMVSEFTKSPAYADSVNSLAITPTVTSLLNAAQRSNNPNSIAGNSVVLTMIRQAQRVGVASDRDAAALGGTQQWGESISRLQNKLMGSGENLTTRDIQELREISEIYKKRSQKLLGDYYGQEKKAFSKRYGIPENQIEEQLGPKVKPYLEGSERTLKSSSLPEGIEFGGSLRYPPKGSERSTVPYEVEGKLFWAEPGNDEEIRNQYPNAKRLK